MSKPVLSVARLTVSYGPVMAVRGLDLSISAGEILCLVGANGAGKSSALKGIMGLEVASGEIVVAGQPVAALPTSLRVRAGIALVPEGRHVFPGLSVEQNLRLGYRDPDESAFAGRFETVLAAFPRLSERLTQAAGTLSGGEQQMLAIGRAMMSGPKVMLLDEPTLGLAPVMVERVTEVLMTLRAQGVAILLAEQNLTMALAVADRGVVLETGQASVRGTADQLKVNPEVRRAYLGIET